MNDIYVKRMLILTNIALILWCGLLTWKQITATPTDIAQLSVRSLFDDYLKEQASKQGVNDDPVLLEARTTAYTRELEAILKELSSRENIIILVSEAVLSDHVVDITPEIKIALKRRLREQNDFRNKGEHRDE